MEKYESEEARVLEYFMKWISELKTCIFYIMSED